MSQLVDLDLALEAAKEAVRAAAKVAMKHFRDGVEVETKDDQSPVTVADRECEAAILEVLKGHFPEHGFLGEETGFHPGLEGLRWIIDPIDGTRGFTRGGPFWGPLVALECHGEIVVGAMAYPVSEEYFWAAKGKGCYRNGERLQVSQIDKLSEATLSLGEMGPIFSPPHHEGIVDLVRKAANARGYGDLAGVGMVLMGKAEIWIEAGVKTWDLAPSRILIEEAGGKWTNFLGEDSLEHGTAIGSNGLLHETALQTILKAIEQA